jgi:hypothetical protein
VSYAYPRFLVVEDDYSVAIHDQLNKIKIKHSGLTTIEMRAESVAFMNAFLNKHYPDWKNRNSYWTT